MLLESEAPPVAAAAQLESFTYDEDIVRKFLWATIIWGLVGFLVGIIVALQLASPGLNLAPWPKDKSSRGRPSCFLQSV